MELRGRIKGISHCTKYFKEDILRYLILGYRKSELDHGKVLADNEMIFKLINLLRKLDN